MSKFKIGDRVIALEEYESNGSIVGQSGRIIDKNDGIYLVEFDKYISGHNGNDHQSNKCGHCWHIPDWNLVLEKPKEVKIYGIAKFCLENYK